MKNQHFTCIKVFQSDGSAGFTNTCFKVHLRTSSIHHQLHCPYTPAQNGRAEKKHRYVTETGLTFLFHSHFSPRFWVDAFNSAAYIINRLPTPLLGGKSPFELLYGTLHIMTIFILLVVVFILACVIICLTNFLPTTLLPFSWVVVSLTKGFFVLILQH